MTRVLLGGALWIGWAMLLVGCGGPVQAVAPPGPREPASAASNPPHVTGAAGVSSAPSIGPALTVLTRVRELKALNDVAGERVGRREMLEHVRRQMRAEVPPDVLRAQRELLFALGVVPESFDYETSLLELMGDQLAGYYDPKKKRMFLAADLGALEGWATLVHELVHALQDQHFGLARHTEYREDAGDEASAVHALAEGDATSAMFDVLQGRPATEVGDAALRIQMRGMAELATSSDVPSVVTRSLIAAYDDGLGLVHWARRRGGWAAVDELWRRLPVSTEQVLHPEKWVAGEPAERVDVPAGVGTLIYRDVLGEQSIRILFEEWMPRRAAVAAASGWGGDRAAVYEVDRGYMLAWRVRWDDEAGARAGAVGFARGVLQSGLRPDGGGVGYAVAREDAEAAIATGELCRERPGRGPFAVRVRGREVSVVAGPYRTGGAGSESAATCSEALALLR